MHKHAPTLQLRLSIMGSHTTQSMPNVIQLRLSKNNFVPPSSNSCQVIMSGHILLYKNNLILFHITVVRFVYYTVTIFECPGINELQIKPYAYKNMKIKQRCYLDFMRNGLWVIRCLACYSFCMYNQPYCSLRSGGVAACTEMQVHGEGVAHSLFFPAVTAKLYARGRHHVTFIQ